MFNHCTLYQQSSPEKFRGQSIIYEATNFVFISFLKEYFNFRIWIFRIFQFSIFKFNKKNNH